MIADIYAFEFHIKNILSSLKSRPFGKCLWLLSRDVKFIVKLIVLFIDREVKITLLVCFHFTVRWLGKHNYSVCISAQLNLPQSWNEVRTLWGSFTVMDILLGFQVTCVLLGRGPRCDWCYSEMIM